MSINMEHAFLLLSRFYFMSPMVNNQIPYDYTVEDRDQDHPHGKEMQKSKMASEEALHIAVKRIEAKSKGQKGKT